MIQAERKHCEICQSAFVGRRDKRFCTDNCRALFHQRHRQKLPSLVKEIDQILKRNRQILAALNPKDKIQVNESRLLGLGFHFNFYTSCYQDKHRKQYFFCYDYGYLKMSASSYLIFKST
ncbi:MAG: hypothetical protein M3Q56_08555 [Bacteroidota bacterium]|nr:hypothetical protein [Bacteroidota bacterium]